MNDKIENLKFKYDHIASKDQSQIAKAEEFSKGYKDFIGKAKTEREATKFIEEYAIKNGYKKFDKNAKYKTGDKIYYNNRDKSIILSTVGKQNILDGINFCVSHIDSPRIDLKVTPMFESDQIAYFKTHYYGGIRKYQWVCVPLAMHGKIFLKNGNCVELCLGEKDDEPKFVISDLLPHLGQKQNDRKLSEGIKASEMNIIISSLPYIEEGNKEEIKDAFKLKALEILNKMYGITEKDFIRSEIEFVPATKPCDIGLDKSMVGAYGQDDRVCAYPSLIAEVEIKNNNKTTVTVFTDKEEIGSEGNTGMVSNFTFDFLEDYIKCIDESADIKEVYRNSLCLSSDVNAAYDPTFSDVFDKYNSSYLNKGPCITKYTGSRGKSGSNDASCETMARIMDIIDSKGVYWQTGDLGEVDIGGGGTIAKYMSQRNIDTIDFGVPVLAMHSPFEITSKLDIYNTYLAYKALYES